jgi:hypothetical protein
MVRGEEVRTERSGIVIESGDCGFGLNLLERNAILESWDWVQGRLQGDLVRSIGRVETCGDRSELVGGNGRTEGVVSGLRMCHCVKSK